MADVAIVLSTTDSIQAFRKFLKKMLPADRRITHDIQLLIDNKRQELQVHPLDVNKILGEFGVEEIAPDDLARQQDIQKGGVSGLRSTLAFIIGAEAIGSTDSQREEYESIITNHGAVVRSRFPLLPEGESRSILCVDLGATSCRIAEIRFTRHGAIFDTPVQTISSRGFFEKRGFDWFMYNITQAITQRRVDGLALCIMGPVDYRTATSSLSMLATGQDGLPVNWNLRNGEWPSELQRILSERLGFPSVVMNDAVGFGVGVHHAHRSENTSYPALCLTLGTGIGSSIIHENHQEASVTPLELETIHRRWSVDFEGDPHELAGETFFNYVCRSTPWDLEEIRRQFSCRIALVVGAISKDLNFATVFIGGGYAGFLDFDEVRRCLSMPTVAIEKVSQAGTALYGAGQLWLRRYVMDKHESEMILEARWLKG